MQPRLLEKTNALLALHRSKDILVLPNAWDVGSAKLFEAAGFPAIATTSSGIEFADGLSAAIDRRRQQMLTAIAKIAAAVKVPVSADIESGLAVETIDIAETVRGVIDAGAVGINLEDVYLGFEVAKRRGAVPRLYDLEDAAARIRAARSVAIAAAIPLVINARTDTFTLNMEPKLALSEAIRRGNAYLDAGADCVFVPYAHDCSDIAALVAGIKGPINILGGPKTPRTSELQRLGVARVSIGGSLARAAAQLVKVAARELKEDGTFTFAKDALSYDETIELLGDS